MAQQRVIHGAMIDFVTPDEMVKMIPRPRQRTRVRQIAQVALDATGAGVDEVYQVPAGYEFEVRRVSVYLAITDPNTAAVTLTGAGKGLAYLRSGAFIEWGQPTYAGVPQVPGVQTWGEEQGPYLRNGERFEVQTVGLVAISILTVTCEGILTRPGENQNA